MKNKSFQFFRYGNLNPVKHKEHGRKVSYHVAPRKKGIYAFPKGYIEEFLIWGEYTNHWNVFLTDSEGRKIEDKDYHDNFDKKYKSLVKRLHLHARQISSQYDENDEKWYIVYKKLPKKFEYSGPLWHHLKDFVSDKTDIIEEYQDWVKTSMDVYIDALHRCDVNERFCASMEGAHHGNPHTHPRCCTKDHYEVFIERL